MGALRGLGVAMGTGLIALLVVLVPSSASQPLELRVIQASPIASPLPLDGRAAAFLPQPEAIGSGWTLIETGKPGADAGVFIDAASAVYVGPNGTRLAVLSYVNRPGRAALQRSWEDVSTVFDNYKSRFGIYSYGREDQLGGQPLADGCVDEKRMDGYDDAFGLPVGITQCAIDPDITVLVVLSGELDGVIGYEASDAIATLSSPVTSSPGAPISPSNSANHLRIAYSSLRRTRKVTGTS